MVLTFRVLTLDFDERRNNLIRFSKITVSNRQTERSNSGLWITIHEWFNLQVEIESVWAIHF